jgi:hypothetical protein
MTEGRGADATELCFSIGLFLRYGKLDLLDSWRESELHFARPARVGEDRPTLLPITLDLKSSPVIWSAPLLLFPHLDLGSSQCGSRPRAITFHGFIEVSH